jgi:uncharacterized protein YciI/uncharacterized damage-inducible protein DinB
MKTCFLLLILAAALPLPAADNGKMNDAERAFLVDQFEQSKKAMLASIQGLSDAQWRFKPAPAVWSVQECAEHIILAEDYLFGAAQQSLQTPAVARPANSNLEYDKVLAVKVQDRSQKATAPEPLVPAQRFATPADAAREFTLRRDKTIAYVKSTSDDLRIHVLAGPAGPMDAYQFLVLLAAHSARHTAQIREVQSNAAYPKTAAALPRFLAACVLAHGRFDQLTPSENAIVQQHGAYLMAQVQKGIIVWGGRTTDPQHPHGYIELEASPADAQAFIDNDPAAKAGLFQCTLDPFTELPRAAKM